MRKLQTVARMWHQMWGGTDKDWWGQSVVSACKHWPSIYLRNWGKQRTSLKAA